MKNPETNTSDSSEPRTDIWALNPANLPYDLEHVDKMRTKMLILPETERINHTLMPSHLENPKQIFHSLPPTEEEFYDGSEKKGLLKRVTWKLGRVATSAANMAADAPSFALNGSMSAMHKSGEKFWKGASRVAASLGSTALELDTPNARIMWPVQNFANTMARRKRDAHEHFSDKAGWSRPRYRTSFDDPLNYHADQAESLRKQAAHHYSTGDLAKAEQLTKQARKARTRHLMR